MCKKKIACDVCGDELDDVIGAQIGFICADSKFKEHPEYRKVLSKFGKVEFHLCFACLITAYGIRAVSVAGEQVSKRVD